MEWYIKKGKKLLKKYLKGIIRPEEKRALAGLLLLNDDQAFAQFLKNVQDAPKTSNEVEDPQKPDFTAIITRAEKRRAYRRAGECGIQYMVAACIAFVLLVLSWWLYRLGNKDRSQDVPYTVVGTPPSGKSNTDLPLSAYGCTVKIANSIARKVNSGDKGLLLKYNQLQIVQHAPGVLQIRKGGTMVFGDTLPRYVVIRTPPLKQYIIDLPDGIHVRMDGGSTISYRLNHKDSLIHFCQLEGQAYVEVEANKKDKLFVLQNTNSQIQTSDGVFVCLSEKGHTRATMLDGAVGLIMRSSLKSVSLKASANRIDAYSFLTTGKKVKDSIADLTCQNRATALYWAKQARRYDHVPLSDFMRDMERWYGFKIENTNCLPKAIHVNITVNYPAKLQEVFAAMEKRGIHVYLNKGLLHYTFSQ